MRFVGNYKDYINQEWIDYISTARGTAGPAERKVSEHPEEDAEFQKLKNAGYDSDAIYHYTFIPDIVPFTLPQPPFAPTSNFKWWFSKMLPGNFMPMHIDAHVYHLPNSRRFWIPLQDWKPGHIFMYEDRVITNYKAGDVWVYDDTQALHGVANIGYEHRLVLQVTTYD